MANSGPSRASGPSVSSSSTVPGAFAWSRLIGAETPAEALAELARWLGAGTAALLLESSLPSTGRIADWSNPIPPQGRLRRRSLEIRGMPIWRLTVTAVESGPADELVDRAGVALEGWREAQLGLDRAEARLADRTRELHVLQSLGRRAAEARSPYDLFVATIEALQQGEGLDLALVAYALDGSPEVVAFQARPFSEETLNRLAVRAGELLGWPADRPVAPRPVELDSYDAARGARGELAESELVVLPILRGEAAVACLLVVPPVGADEGDLRLLYSASNQLCLHLDRILTVREAEADRFRSILDSMPQAVVLADQRMGVVQFNNSARSLFCDLGIVEGNTLEETLHGLQLAGLAGRVMRGEIPGAETEIRVDTNRMFNVTISPLAGQRRDERWLVIVLSDVTESRRLQQQLAHSEKMSSLGQMISGVAHELNNPLTSILGYTQLLGAQEHPEELRKRIDVLGREAERCRRIVRNLLSFARARAPRKEALSLNEVIQAVLSLMGYQLRVSNIDVRTELDSSLPAIHGDSHELQQVLVNLLTNARQAIFREKEGGEIRIRTEVSPEGVVEFELRDDGPGIPEAIRGKIFDPFFTTKDDGQGTGLGLSLVYGIIRSHGGTIEFFEPEGSGAGFRITFPAAGGRDEPCAEAAVEESATSPRAGHILVVDDEPSLAALICEALAEEGHRVESASDGRQAIELIARNEFDLVISDVKMPGMDGEALHAEMQRLNPELAGRLLLATGDTAGETPEQVASRTGLEVLHKPFDLADLRRLVRLKLAAITGEA